METPIKGAAIFGHLDAILCEPGTCKPITRVMVGVKVRLRVRLRSQDVDRAVEMKTKHEGETQ